MTSEPALTSSRESKPLSLHQTQGDSLPHHALAMVDDRAHRANTI